MRNGMLFNKQRKKKVDTIFRNVDTIQKAVAEVRLDSNQEHISNRGTNKISRPTESIALKNISDVKCVCITTEEGDHITVCYPERWLYVFERCCRLYADTDVMNAIRKRYLDKTTLTDDRTCYVQLERFLSDSFILAVQNRLVKV